MPSTFQQQKEAAETLTWPQIAAARESSYQWWAKEKGVVDKYRRGLSAS